MKNKVILVDENDRPKGVMDKLEAHQKGLLHRAISVFVFNPEGKLLLQKRASGKYHSPGLWTNTCCTHPMPEETVLQAAVRRLNEEMGITSDLEYTFSFKYRANLDNDLIEHEFDHVFIGYSNHRPVPNPNEVESWKFLSRQEIAEELNHSPSVFTAWFKLCYENAFTRHSLSASKFNKYNNK